MFLTKLAIALISPLGTALALWLLALLLLMLRWRRLAVTAGMLGGLWLAVWSTPELSYRLQALTEAAFPPQAAAALPPAPALVVLGGGIAPPGAGDVAPDLSSAADRVWFAAQLYHAGKAPLLILAGGSDPSVSRTSEAAAMQRLLTDLGVPAAAMLREERSRNTRENARFSAELLRERGIEQILLVTSALHMRRALGLFEATGLQVIPAATDHEAKRAPPGLRWIPSTDALDASGRTLKEWVGRLAGY